MSQTQQSPQDLSSLDAIRKVFLERFQATNVGYHTLGEQVLEIYFSSQEQLARPASAMTFRNFLQGKTNLRDPTGLMLYFQTLGASEDEIRRIRGAMQTEVDRRLAAPGQDQALRAFRDTELSDMPYSRALAECEAATRFEQSISMPIASLTPTAYLMGTPGPGGVDDPRTWGLLQHCEAMQRFMESFELRLQDDFAEVPKGDRKQRRWLAAAGVRETGRAYTSYLLAYPEQAELLLSHRRFLLHGPMPERERMAAFESVQGMVQSLYHPFERFAQEVLLDGDKKQLCRTPDGELALEQAGNRLFGIGMMFYVTSVLGSSGSGGFFVASHRASREFAGEPLKVPSAWSDSHDFLMNSHEQTLGEAARMLEANPRVRYGEMKALFDEQQEQAKPHHHRVWERDYAPSFVREAGMLLAGEFHHRGLLSSSGLTSFLKTFTTGAEGKRLQEACFTEPMFMVPERPA